MSLTTEDVEDLRRSLKATRTRLEENTDALQDFSQVQSDLVVEIRKFNENVGDLLNVAEQLIPLAEGAAAGSTAMQAGIQMVRGLFEARRKRKAGK